MSSDLSRTTNSNTSSSQPLSTNFSWFDQVYSLFASKSSPAASSFQQQSYIVKSDSEGYIIDLSSQKPIKGNDNPSSIQYWVDKYLIPLLSTIESVALKAFVYPFLGGALGAVTLYFRGKLYLGEVSSKSASVSSSRRKRIF